MRFSLLIGISSIRSEFVATNEWQIVPDDEPLPPGLHYSIDFSTGERKAKLLEPEEPNPDTESSLVLMPEKLEQAEIVQEEKPELTEAQKLSIKKINDYLNEQELHKTEPRNFDELGVELVADFDLMKNITNALKTAASIEVKERALEELEFLVHQIDNAADLMQLDGVELLLELIEKGLSEKIRMLSAETVAAASQGNSKVKVDFINGRAISRLLTQIIQSESDAWTKKLLYPLGAIIRDFPYAESVFYRHGGAQGRDTYLK